ncbi:hypothetical protein [Methylomonas sp. HYX-M1]|uniref:hypothetical protein n=1 Tax=Methylomonas sp. HYX-M1 TaxID=3139307 RepID=UPI00345BB791
MNRVLFIFAPILGLLIEGCAAPGSGIGNLAVSGRLTSSSDQPISGKEIQFILPATYGLGGLDLVMNSPDDFGHKDRRFNVTTDENGQFYQDLGQTIYHVTCWLLPPVGCYPSGPPAPFLLVRLPDNQSEYYAVQTQDGQFKVFTMSGKETPVEESSVKSISTKVENSNDKKERSTVGVINIQIK